MDHQRRPVLVLGAAAFLAGALAVGGCARPDVPSAAVAPAESGASPTSVPATAARNAEPTDRPAEPDASEPTAPAVEHRVTYDWAAPSDQVTIAHPAEVPLPYLTGIYVGDHPDGSPPYQRIAFYFREGFPEYNLQYVRAVLAEGTGAAISLQGNAFLRIGFVNAQAHDDSGASTVETAPDTTIGFTNLKSYGSAGDFEAHVTYGLGIQVAPYGDQVLLVRAGELTTTDSSGELNYVVYVDIQTG